MSPYAVAKVAAYEACAFYARVYKVRVCTGLAFNHESSLRSEDFVTMKIVRHAVMQAKHPFIKIGPLKLGNLHASRDWGHAKDYCHAFHKMVLSMHNKPTVNELDSFVIATGTTCSVK